jgi:hypothetical protein
LDNLLWAMVNDKLGLREENHTMLLSSELDDLSDVDRYFALAFAYIDSAISLCRALYSRELPYVFTSACPMLWLTRHATELFYKACLFSSLGFLPSPPKKLNRHNLMFLQEEFKKVFPEFALTFEPPASESLSDGEWSEDEIVAVQRGANRNDQRNRYPVDSQNRKFQDVQMVTPENMLEKLRSSRDQMIVISSRARIQQNRPQATPDEDANTASN